MPKIKYLPSAKPKVNYLAALFRAYRKATGMTSDQIGKAVGVAPSYARTQMNKPGRKWRIEELLKYCDALGIPYEDALREAIR